MTLPSCFNFIREIWARGICRPEFGQEVIVNRDNIHWEYQQYSFFVLIAKIGYFTILPESNHLSWPAQLDIFRMKKIGATRHWVRLIHGSFTAKDAHTWSKWHQSFNPVNLSINKFITWLF
jgi:hypothetical protein